MFMLIMLFIYFLLVVYLYHTRKIIAVRIDEFKRWRQQYQRELEEGTFTYLKEIEKTEEEIIKSLE